MQTFVPYSRPYALPLPLVAPTAVTSAPDVNYPDVSGGGLMALANATSNFALRFSGESPARKARYCLPTRASSSRYNQNRHWQAYCVSVGTCRTQALLAQTSARLQASCKAVSRLAARVPASCEFVSQSLLTCRGAHMAQLLVTLS